MNTVVAVLVVGIVLIGIVLGARSASRNGTSPAVRSVGEAEALRTPLPPDTRNRVLELIRQQKKIQAIKVLREATGYGLKEAKEVVEALEAGRGPGSTQDAVPSEPPAVPGGTDRPRSADLAERARRLRADGQEVQAIRLVCDETGMGIPEAQSFVRSLS